ncbi:MAG TPA: hypothetical protein VHB45_07145 [Alloacidobacterium sp.]|nr:hypothetical protein [Alloacidobacterium sp.]
MGTFTVSTPYPIIFGLPRPFLIAMLFTVFMYISLKGSIGIKYIQFALAYLAAFVPSTLYGLMTTQIKWTSAIQMIAMQGVFCVLCSYFYRWLSRNSDREKSRWCEVILIYFLFITVLNLVFYSQFSGLMSRLYPSVNGELYSIVTSQRELSDYGGRASAFFSEPSNYAKFLSIIVAVYMTVSRCSKRSIAALLLFAVLIRSVSFLYAAPAMFYAWWRLSRPPSTAAPRRIGPGATRILLASSVVILLIAGILVTQSGRLSKAHTGGDNSLNGRILLPLKYMSTHADLLVAGYGLTPQDDIANFSIMAYAMSSGHLTSLTSSMTATSTTVTFLVGVGIAGLAVFYALMFLMQRSEGVWLVTVFLLSNFINAGYNSSTMFVLSGLLITLLSYQVYKSREDRRRMLAELESELAALENS